MLILDKSVFSNPTPSYRIKGDKVKFSQPKTPLYVLRGWRSGGARRGHAKRWSIIWGRRCIPTPKAMLFLAEAASTSDAVCLITYVQQLKREVLAWEKQVDIYREAQRILERQRYVTNKINFKYVLYACSKMELIECKCV